MTSDRIKLIRSKNLQLIIEKVGLSKDVAETVECDRVYISQIINGHRVMGDRFAARVEKAFQLPEGALSIDPDAPPPGAESLATYRTAVETVLALKLDQVQAVLPVLQNMQNK